MAVNFLVFQEKSQNVNLWDGYFSIQVYKLN